MTERGGGISAQEAFFGKGNEVDQIASAVEQPMEVQKPAEQGELKGNYQARFDALCTKLGIDPNEEVNPGDMNFMIKAMQPGSKEWLQMKFDTVRGIVADAEMLGQDDPDSGYFPVREAESALKSWESYDPNAYVVDASKDQKIRDLLMPRDNK